jgi:RNA polymerase sigma factor (sigma-70 family)
MDDLDALVDTARAGGHWAFTRLWEELATVVASYLRARGVRDVDDATSEVFLAAFRGISRFEGDGAAFRAWLFTIAHHKAVDTYRRGSARDVLMESVDDGRTQPSAEETALGRLADVAARRWLAVLTDDQRAVILLRVIGDLSLAETARVLDRPVGAVKALQHRALVRLRAAMTAEGVSRDGGQTITRSR